MMYEWERDSWRETLALMAPRQVIEVPEEVFIERSAFMTSGYTSSEKRLANGNVRCTIRRRKDCKP